MRRLGSVLALFFLAMVAGFAAEYYVSPDGTRQGTGEKDRPWDLETAFSHPAAVQPGDRIWIRGGRYGGGGNTLFRSKLNGTEAAPIIVRRYADERAIIDGGIEATGSWTWFWGFEITNSTEKRMATQATRQGGLDLHGRGHRAINLIIHDTGHPAVGFWAGVGDGGEMHGCIIWGAGIYDISWNPIARRGSAIYAQNETGTRYISDTIAFRNWTNAIDLYTENGFTNGFHIEGNVTFDNPEGNIFATGGANPMRRLRMLRNYTYMKPDASSTSVRLGYGRQTDAIVEDNYFVGGKGESLAVRQWSQLVVSGNTIVGLSSENPAVDFIGSPQAKYLWDNNAYYSTNTHPFDIDDHASHPFEKWKEMTGFDASSSLGTAPPPDAVIIRKNKYEPGRSHLIVYNWSRKATMDVDLASVLSPGAEYEIRDVQNLFGAPVAAGTYDGKPVPVPMNLTEVTPLVGASSHFESQHTGPVFNVFLVTSRCSGSAAPEGPGQNGLPRRGQGAGAGSRFSGSRF